MDFAYLIIIRWLTQYKKMRLSEKFIFVSTLRCEGKSKRIQNVDNQRSLQLRSGQFASCDVDYQIYFL